MECLWCKWLRIYANEGRLNEMNVFLRYEFEVGINDSIFSGNSEQQNV